VQLRCIKLAEADCLKTAMQENRPGIVRDAVTGNAQIHDLFVQLSE